ncbi:MAG: hypothetical protein P4L50_26155 [Anaerolineaceae bacterium]|nr:hypothetical protein [Anaerolineaceae bacterium]
MGKYGEIQEEFFVERTRILDALSRDENKHMVMRLIGALAFRTHCPEYGYIQDALGRVFTDIDFATYTRYVKDVSRLLPEMGYEEDKIVTQLFGEGRMIFHDPKFGRHIDIFIDRLDFCHVLPLANRLEADKLTLPLAELLLEKMQIVQLNEKDLIDTIMLLREHPIGESDDETINANLISRLLGNDWGYWRTVTGNLDKVNTLMDKYSQLTDEDKKVVRERIKELKDHIDATPKTMRWKVRGSIGERVKWYKDVEELEDR